MPDEPTLPTTDPIGSVPPDNQPGHHPEVEQDKPVGPPPRPRLATVRYDFAFDPLFRLPALAVGVTPGTASVEVGADDVLVRFGLWQMRVDREDIAGATVTGPYRVWKVIGPPHLSFSDRGITFATNARRGVCIELRRPVPGIEPTGRLRHPGLTVTVADVDGLVGLLT